jgi:hypothetical protein
LIAAERARQVRGEQWTTAHDDEHTEAQLAGAAHSYVEAAYRQINTPILAPSDEYLSGSAIRPAKWWTWAREWWKPSDDPIRNLVKAGALIAAEIDRLQRRDQP